MDRTEYDLGFVLLLAEHGCYHFRRVALPLVRAAPHPC
jgi:hypothetical protein